MKIRLYILLLFPLLLLSNAYANNEAKSVFEQLKDERDRLVREDNRLYSSLVQNCNKPELQCSVYSGDSFNRDILRLKREVDKLNLNPKYINSFGVLESKAIAWTKVTQEFTDFNLIPKTISTPRPWDGLPTRTDEATAITVDKSKKTEKLGFVDPYANVSDELSQNKINEEAKSYANAINTLIAIAEVVASSSTNQTNGGGLAGGPQLAPGNANHCMNFRAYNRGRFTIENTCPFRIQTYRCESTERLGLSCITTMPIRPNHHNESHPYSPQVNGVTVQYGACSGKCDPGGAFYIDDGKSPDCECKPSEGTAGTAR